MSEGMLVLGVLVPLSILTSGGVLLILMGMYQRTKTLEMEHRERLAMIQRGLVPAPETDPLGFESAVGPYESDRSERWRTAGTLTIGLGLALAVLLTVTAEASNVGLGIGGAFIVLGTAILLNGYQRGRSRRPAPRPLAARRQFDGPFPPMDPPSTAP